MPRWVGRAGWTALFAALGGLVAWLALGKVTWAPPPGPQPGVACSVAGHTLPAGDAAAIFDAARPVLEAWLAQPLTLVVGDARPLRTRAELGVRIDWGRLRSLATQAQNPASSLRRSRAPGAPPGGVLLPVPYWVDEQAAMAALLQMKEGYDQPPVDARFDFKTKAVSPDATGRRLDAWATLGRLDSALERGAAALEVLVETEAPRHTAAELAGAAGVATDHVMGWFETQYARDAKHEARAFNLQVAASKLDGFVLMPEDTFDFNQVVGPRDEAHGYKVAP
ncbi:MAG: VanW family protein, partial [Polyangiaceae bacterium]